MMRLSDSKSRILIVCQAIPQHKIPIYQRLARSPSIDLEVVATYPHPSRPEGINDMEFCGHFRESRIRMRALTYRKMRFKMLPSLLFHIWRERPHVVIFADSIFQPILINFPLWILYKLCGAKLVRWGCSGYEDPSQYPTASFTGKFILWLKNKTFRWNYADAELAYSEFTAQYLHEQMNVPKERIFIAYNSVDTEKLDAVSEICKTVPPIIPKNDRRIIFIGRLIEQKRVDILLRAFEVVSRKLADCEVLIIGDGPERHELGCLARDLGIGRTVKFLGAIYDDMLKAQYMLSSALLVLPGLGGLSINEAMYFGLPVVCSVADGTEKQLVYDGITGYIADYADVDDYANKITTILQDEALRVQMGENARSIIRDKVNIQSMASGFQDAIDYVMRGKEGKSSSCIH